MPGEGHGVLLLGQRQSYPSTHYSLDPQSYTSPETRFPSLTGSWKTSFTPWGVNSAMVLHQVAGRPRGMLEVLERGLGASFVRVRAAFEVSFLLALFSAGPGSSPCTHVCGHHQPIFHLLLPFMCCPAVSSFGHMHMYTLT